jgi:hypothetical protein
MSALYPYFQFSPIRFLMTLFIYSSSETKLGVYCLLGEVFLIFSLILATSKLGSVPFLDFLPRHWDGFSLGF